MNYLSKEKVEVVAYQIAKKGNSQCGDSYFITSNDEYFLCVLADGLGSGQYAFESSSIVTNMIKEYHYEDVNSLMKRCNDALVYNRGAAVAILKVLYPKKKFIYSCVGNIRFFLYSKSGQLTYPLPVTGYLAGKPQKFHTQNYPYEENSRFVIYSDGFNLKGVKSLLKSYVPIEKVAEEIKKNHIPTDDATFIVGKLL